MNTFLNSIETQQSITGHSITIIPFVLCCFLFLYFPNRAFSEHQQMDSVAVSQEENTQYFAASLGYAHSDATQNRLGILYSIMYGHKLSAISDVEFSFNITGTDGFNNGIMRLFVSRGLNVTYLIRPFNSSSFRIGVGFSLRHRQFYWSAPNFQSPFDEQDRFVSDIGIGGNIKMDYTIFETANIALGLVAQGQYFIALPGTYYFQNTPTTLQNLRLETLAAPRIVGLGAILRVSF